jgi:hypothetical protein
METYANADEDIKASIFMFGKLLILFVTKEITEDDNKITA